jgi:hypothetical protein
MAFHISLDLKADSAQRRPQFGKSNKKEARGTDGQRAA